MPTHTHNDTQAIGIKEPRSFTLQQLKKELPRREVVATLQCAGNRQFDFIEKERPLYVAPIWQNGAIGDCMYVCCCSSRVFGWLFLVQRYGRDVGFTLVSVGHKNEWYTYAMF
jgi:DMSO/TMAO reductase YedYZ molybdopterin-dependent catalytic subunit